MFDFHIHSRVSFDSREEPRAILAAAEAAGLQEICFTDHLDYDPADPNHNLTFHTNVYNDAYSGLESDRVRIRRGMEFGMLPDNRAQLEADLQRRSFDFVIGSVHFAAGLDVYYPAYWQGVTQAEGERRYLEDVLECVRAHEDFDVLGHLTYISKANANPSHRAIPYGDHKSLTDQILRELIRKEKGLEINTSGIGVCGAFLPDEGYLRRFYELGGRIVTVGSDAHKADRVGRHCAAACALALRIFGHVCTFQNRHPIFHKNIK